MALRSLQKDYSLDVTIRDRTGLLFEGKVSGITSFNDKGEFDILPLHTNFISLIKKEIILHLGGSDTQSISVEQGVMSVKNDQAEVYLGVVGMS